LEYRLVDVGRRLDKAEQNGIGLIAQHLCRLKQLNYATEMYRKLGDEKSIVQLYVQAGEWKEAFSLIENHPEFKDLVYVQYAQWLAENDKFAEAQKGMLLLKEINSKYEDLTVFKMLG
jgi:intraflagellar transport protein 122